MLQRCDSVLELLQRDRPIMPGSNDVASLGSGSHAEVSRWAGKRETPEYTGNFPGSWTICQRPDANESHKPTVLEANVGRGPRFVSTDSSTNAVSFYRPWTNSRQ